MSSTLSKGFQKAKGVKCRKSDNEKILLENVVQIRKKLQITQTELAEMSGNSQQEISRLEKRKHSPSIRTLCNILNSVDYELSLRKRESSSVTE